MRFFKVSLMGLMTVALASFAVAQTPPPSISIIVPKMHCKNCAQKMATELYKVPGVGQVFVSIEKTTMTVQGKDGQVPSPRGLWEAVERAGYQPSLLQGPSGDFASKPKS
ncbi:MAG: heavy-metal-associated domain-containing protein [Gemmataceae bacterium]|nr:heavy-metal-associated domain-containing protein [Gemmataceae bacterium]